jgi:hypothetical protein
MVLSENNGIQPRIVLLHALQIALKQLTRTDFFVPDLAGKRERRRNGQILHDSSSLSGCCRTLMVSCGRQATTPGIATKVCAAGRQLHWVVM